jgi:hypothetical protein
LLQRVCNDLEVTPWNPSVAHLLKFSRLLSEELDWNGRFGKPNAAFHQRKVTHEVHRVLSTGRDFAISRRVIYHLVRKICQASWLFTQYLPHRRSSGRRNVRHLHRKVKHLFRIFRVGVSKPKKRSRQIIGCHPDTHVVVVLHVNGHGELERSYPFLVASEQVVGIPDRMQRGSNFIRPPGSFVFFNRKLVAIERILSLAQKALAKNGHWPRDIDSSLKVVLRRCRILVAHQKDVPDQQFTITEEQLRCWT